MPHGHGQGHRVHFLGMWVWVLGQLEPQQKRGWFPPASTCPLQSGGVNASTSVKFHPRSVYLRNYFNQSSARSRKETWHIGNGTVESRVVSPPLRYPTACTEPVESRSPMFQKVWLQYHLILAPEAGNLHEQLHLETNIPTNIKVLCRKRDLRGSPYWAKSGGLGTSSSELCVWLKYLEA